MRKARVAIALFLVSVVGPVHAEVPPPTAGGKIVKVAAHRETSLDAKQVRARVATALPSILRCYQQLLEKLPDAAGALTLRFTVDAVGKVAKIRARAFDGALAGCVRRQVAHWRLPIPLHDATPTTAAFSIVIAFAPAPAP